jgi:hypothetical protein
VSHTHLALWWIWLCALTTSLPCSDRPSVSIVSSTSSKRPSGLPRNPIPRTTSSGWPRIGTRSRWRSPVSRHEVSITAEQNVVTIEGNKAEKAGREFLYRGISTRHFKRQFSLADYVQVKDATFDNGLLKIELVREIPEAMKPRRIAINGASSADNVRQIEAKAA